MSRAIVVGRLQCDDDVAIVGQGQSSLGDGWSRDVTAQTLKLLALMRFTGNTSMQRKACLLAYQVVAFALPGSHWHRL
jgi:hypothetical protein